MRYATARSVSAELIKRERLGSNMEQLSLHLTWARAHARIELLRSSLGAVGGLLGVLGGASLMVHFGGGLYVCALGTLIMIWVVIWNAFSMMIATYADDAPI